MKKIIVAAFICIMSFNTFAKKVEFTVNMTGLVIDPTGVYVMGDFQSVAGYGVDWTPNTCLMTQDLTDTNLYHFSVDIPAFAKYEYKYLNGDQSYFSEVVPLESQVGYNFVDNRWIYVDSLDADTMHLAPLIFSANAPAGLNMIRFLVDMTTATVSSNGVHVAGSFQSNNPATHRLYSFQNNVYEIISYMPLGNYTYKFYNGNNSSDAETVPTACATSGERTIALTHDSVLANVCFSSCSTCYPSYVSNVKKESAIQLYPNPMDQKTAIYFNDGSTIHHIAITDVSGRQVFKQLMIQDQVYNLSRHALQSGIYTVTVENKEGARSSQKLMVE